MALRRSLDAGGHRSFAPALQIVVVALAAFSMPLSIAALEALYNARAVVGPQDVFRQVFVAQLLPLGLAVLLRRARPGAAAWFAPRVGRAAKILLLLLVALVLINAWHVVIEAGPWALIAIAVTSLLALAVGHALGGPEPSTRTATAISSAMRNPSLALVVATLNAAPPAITATVVAYLIVATLVVLPYVFWRRRTGALARGRDPRITR
jgi:BASS family bile acid:Na+ symporter